MEKIRGIWIKKTEFKTCLYADDVLITLSQPDLSLPKLLSCLITFGYYLGYKLNIHKTQIICYNYTPAIQIHNLGSSNWENDKMKYLGITIPKNLSNIYAINYLPIT